MPRTARASVGGLCYHAMNRGNRRAIVYHDAVDYEHFLRLIAGACARVPLEVFAYCLMPNHFHLVVRPRDDGGLGRWMHWLLSSHVRRYHRRYGTSGRIWQGRFDAFPVQEDAHLFAVVRYVERNALRARLVERAERWAWGSLRERLSDDVDGLLATMPFALPRDWAARVNAGGRASEVDAIRGCVDRGRPFGSEAWTRRTAHALGLEGSLRKYERSDS